MAFAYFLGNPCLLYTIIVELAERSPIIIQNSSNPSSRKNLVVRPYDRTTVRSYDRTTVQGATFNMLTTRVLVLARVRRCALETCGKKNASSAFRLC